ncbi:MAG TPA: putative sulfate/molybdate transporter [candidate division Zixibacteria bacterium]|nr:putative sulfate/molybdate transporter [candidate division Zixibacteria bacterium]
MSTRVQISLPNRSAVPNGSSSFGIRFDRNEFSGAFGDIGTDLPLIVGVILASGLDAPSVLIMFGLMQILSGLIYRLPMPVQPLKAMAVIVIGQKVSPDILYGGGLAIGITMLVLSATGLIDWLARIVPKNVIRGIQFGLGLQLSLLALKDYVQADGAIGLGLAVLGFTITLFLLGNRRYPPALILIGLGILYAFAFKVDSFDIQRSIGFHLPALHVPTVDAILAGWLLLALPQLALSLGNSILATRQVIEDLFPGYPVTIRKISWTYSLMNLVNPFLSGYPTCHGSGGMAGHYAFGARTGGSVIIEGALYLILGLVFGTGFEQVIQIFPKPILGIVLFFEGLTLIKLVGDMTGSKQNFMIVLMVGLAAVGLPYGYVIGLLAGTLVAYLTEKGLARLGE